MGAGWDCLVHHLIPVSGTGTGSLIPLPSRERGIGWVFCLVVSPAPHLWIADQVRNDGTMLRIVLWILP